MNFICRNDFFFLPQSASSVSRSQAHIAKRCSSVCTTIFVWRKDKTNYLSNQTWAKCYHSRNKLWLKRKTLDGGPYTIQNTLKFLKLRKYFLKISRKIIIIVIILWKLNTILCATTVYFLWIENCILCVCVCVCICVCRENITFSLHLPSIAI